MFPTQLLILFLLLNSVHGTRKTPHVKQKLYQLLKPIPPDYDNRYVWITRNIHSEVKGETQNEEPLRKNNFNVFFYLKESTVKLEKLVTR
jgi:hypothetical protein